MNILFFSESFYPHGGGAEYASYIYANLLSSMGVNVTVITNKFTGEKQYSKKGKLIVYRLPLFRNMESVKYNIFKRFDVLFSSFIRNMIKWADVVYIPRYWYSMIPLAKAYHKKVVLHIHDYIIICPLANLYNLPQEKICNRRNSLCSPTCIYGHERNKGTEPRFRALLSASINSTLGHYMGWLANWCDAIICVSEAQKKLIAQSAPSLNAKIHVVYNPLPKMPYIPLEGDDFAYFGGDSMLKGYHIIYQSLKNVMGNKITVRATGFSRNIKSIVKLSNGSRIKKYGWLRGKKLQDIYRSTKAVIVPSICPEPLPYVIYEAILSGRLIIASKVGGIPEQVNNISGSYLFTPGKYEELTNILYNVSLIEKEKVLDIGMKNRNTLLKKNQNNVSIKKFMKVMRDLL